MSAQTRIDGRPTAGNTEPEKAPRALRILGLVAVCAGVAALAAATFVLSYSGIHVLALQAGIAPRLARGYPLVIDAMLVIVLAAVLALRGAGLPSKLFAWATLIVVLAAAAGADALHAAGRKLPDHVAAVTAAVVPWVLVFLAFSLLLAMLRYARIRRQAAARRRVVPHGQARAHWQPGSELSAGQLAPAAAPAFAGVPLAPVPVPASAVPASAVPPVTESASAEWASAEWAGSVADVPQTADAAAGLMPEFDETVSEETVSDETVSEETEADEADSEAIAFDGPEFDGPEFDEAAAEDVQAESRGDGEDDEAGPADGAAREVTQPFSAAYPEAGAGLADYADADEDPEAAAYPTVQAVLAVPRQPGPSVVADADPAFTAGDSDLPDLAVEADQPHDDPASDEAAADPATGDVPYPADATAASPDGGITSDAGAGSDATADDEPDMPVFHRMWSSPTPPAGM